MHSDEQSLKLVKNFTRVSSNWIKRCKMLNDIRRPRVKYLSALLMALLALMQLPTLADQFFRSRVSPIAMKSPSSSNVAFTQQQELLPDDNLNESRFGFSVAISGETSVVGAPTDYNGIGLGRGAAYIFIRSGSTWTKRQKLIADDSPSAAFFGSSIAMAQDTIVVGARYAYIGANNNQGSAYVFIRSGTTWIQQAKLVASDGIANQEFGASVAIDGDTIVVGAPFGNTGLAYVFVRSGSKWIQQQKLIANDGSGGDLFGSAVTISGNTIITGSPYNSAGSSFPQGAAYVFVRNGLTWTQQQKLIASDQAQADQFGSVVTISGDVAVIGVPLHAVGSSPAQGSAYIFLRSGSSWTERQKITASDGGVDDGFSSTLVISGDLIVVGAPGKRITSNERQGSVYVFARTGFTWIEQQKLVASDGKEEGRFGTSIAIDRDTLLVSGMNGRTLGGAAYVFVLPPPPPCIQPPAGLIAWWPGDRNATDVQGDNNGRLREGAGFAVGKVREAFSFDAINDFIEVPDSDLWAFGTSDFTIDLWANFHSVKPSTLTTPACIFIGNAESALGQNKWYFALGGGMLHFHVDGPSTGASFLAQAPFSPVIGQWYHLTVIRAGKTFIIYVDGVPVASEVSSLIIPNPNAPLTIGQAANQGFMDGLIDEVEVFNRALSAGEVQAITSADIAGECKPPCTAPPPNLVSWWPGNGSATDIQGGHNGNLGSTVGRGIGFTAGKVGEGFLFTGGFISVKDHPALSPQRLTIDAWIKTDGVPAGSAGTFIAAKSGKESGLGYEFGITPSGFLRFTLNGGNRGADLIGDVNVADSQFHHVAAVYNGEGMLIYLDGQLHKQKSLVVVTISYRVNMPFIIGSRELPSASRQDWSGIIDELEFFDRALFRDEIRAIFDVRGIGKCQSGIPPVSVMLDPKATFLHTVNDSPNEPTIIDLAAVGFIPGDILDISYKVSPPGWSPTDCGGPFLTPDETPILAVFSKSGTLLPTDQLKRIPEAIDIGPDIDTPKPFRGGMTDTTNIKEDFRVSPSEGFTIAIPAGATHLFLGMNDDFFADDCGTIEVTLRQRTGLVPVQAGKNVIVESDPATVTFSTATTAGALTVMPVDPNSAGQLPGQYVVVNNLAFEIETTASYTPPVVVCFHVPSVTQQMDFDMLRILHGEAGMPCGSSPCDRTILAPDTPAPDFATKTICARVNVLSPFVIARLSNQPPVARCRNVTVIADDSGMASINPRDVDNGSFDPDGDAITLMLDSIGPFQIGTHPVKLTVTDNQGASSSCTATITVTFNVCLQDEGNGSWIQFNSATGNYQFTACNGHLMFSGTGFLTKKGRVITLQHFAVDRRILASFDGGVNKGAASVQIYSLGRTFMVIDRDTADSTCTCR